MSFNNLSFQICATVLLVIGGYVLYQQLSYQSVIHSLSWVPTAVICGIGLVKYLVCYFGWRATAGRNKCLISLVSFLKSYQFN